MLLGESEGEGVGGLQEEQVNKKKSNSIRQGVDDESLIGRGGIWVLFILMVSENPLTQSEIFSRRGLIRFMY